MSVEVELAALDPRTRPTKFRAIGDVGNRVMEKYRAFGWDESVPIEENLKTACAVSFPHPSSSVGAEEEDDPDILCGICYGYKLVIDAGEQKMRKLHVASRALQKQALCNSLHVASRARQMQALRNSSLRFSSLRPSTHQHNHSLTSSVLPTRRQ